MKRKKIFITTTTITLIVTLCAIGIHYFSEKDTKENIAKQGGIESSPAEMVQDLSDEETLTAPFDSRNVNNNSVDSIKSGDTEGNPTQDQKQTKKSKLISDLIDISGSKGQLTSMDETLDYQLALAVENIPNSDVDKLESTEKAFKTVKNSMKGEKLLRQIKEDLAETFSVSELEELNDLYNTPEMVSFHEKARSVSMSPDALRDLQQFMKDNGFEKTAEESKTVIGKMIEQYKVVEKSTAIFVGISKNIFAGMNHPDSKDYDKQARRFQKNLENMDKDVRKKIKSSLQNVYAFYLKDFSKGEMKSFTKSSLNPLMSKFNEVSLNAMKKSIDKAREQIIKETKKASSK